MGKKKVFEFSGVVGVANEQKKEAEEKEKGTVAYIKKHLVIYEELKFLVPPLTPDELHKLELSIKEEGCRDPLVVWQKNEEEAVLIDGHNRYMICHKNGVEFDIVFLDFDEYDSVVNWIVNNQLGKRNATEETKSYLRGLQYHREKKRETNWQNLRQYAGTEAENTPTTGNTAARLGELHKVSEKTIKRDERFALAIDKLCGTNHNLKSEILQRNLILPKGKLTEIADESEEKVRALGKALEDGIGFKKAYQSIFLEGTPEITDYQTYSRQKAFKSLKNNILQSLDSVIKTGDKKLIQDLRTYLDELENSL